MFISSPARTRSLLGRQSARRGITGRGTSVGLFIALVASVVACENDGSTQNEPTGLASAGDRPDASVRDLPGDGLEPTPEFDIEARQREPIGPEQLNETIGDFVADGGIGSGGYTAPPAPAPAPAPTDPDAGG